MKSILMVLILSLKIFACSMCQIDVPMVHVNVQTTIKNNKTILDIQWEFSQDFTQHTLRPYDIDEDGNFGKEELNLIQQNLEEYIQKDHHLTFLKYSHKTQSNNDIQILNTSFSNQTMDYKDKKIYYYFRATTPIEYAKDHKLFVEFYDKGEFFKFVLQQFNFKHPLFHSQLQKTYDTTLFFYDPKEILQTLSKQEKRKQTPTLINKKPESKTILQMLSDILNDIKESMQELLQDIKNNNAPSAYFWLLLFSFLYGVIHAIGPGHGKSLVSAYFLGENRSMIKAFNISALIGIVHTFSALILTLIVYYVIESFFSTLFDDVEQATTKISALFIIAIALYLLYNKLKKKRTKLNSFAPAPNASFLKTPQEPISHVHTHSCECSACKTNSTDLMVVLAAGIVPCPGTVTIFIFTLSMGVLFVGFLSAVFMSLGMSLIIFITVYLSIKVRGKLIGNSSLKIALEYGSLLFIFSLGVLLLLI